MDEDCPDIDENEQRNIGHLVEREDEGEDMVRYALGPTVDWMESMTGERCRHDPFVVWLVESLVNVWMVETSVDPVDEEVREENEEWELDEIVEVERRIVERVVHLCIASNFGGEEGCSEECHARDRHHSLLDLKLDLILQIFRVSESVVVKDEVVGQAGTNEVQNKTKYPKNASGFVETWDSALRTR